MRPLLYIASFLVLVSSCGLGAAADDATVVANTFNQLIVDQKYDKLESFLDQTITEQYSEEHIDQIFAFLADGGPYSSYKKGLGFNTQISNGVTTVELHYTLKGENKNMSEDLTLVKRGNTYKISSIYFE